MCSTFTTVGNRNHRNRQCSETNGRKEIFLHALLNKIDKLLVQTQWYRGQKHKRHQIKLTQQVGPLEGTKSDDPKCKLCLKKSLGLPAVGGISCICCVSVALPGTSTASYPYLLPAVTNCCGLHRTKSQPEVGESGTEVQPA